MLPEFAVEEFAAALDAIVEELLDRSGVLAPPVDALAVAAALGIVVALDDRQAGRARFVRLGGHAGSRTRESILLRPEPRAERRQWAVAHEIGERSAAAVFARLDVDPAETPPTARERIANDLAGRILLPSAWFIEAGLRCNWDLFALKSIFATASHELIARRMLQCEPPIVVTLFDQGRVTWRRSNLPGRLPPLWPGERQLWRWIHHAARPGETPFEGGTIRGWPVHEMDWRREILRTEVELMTDVS